MLQRAMSLYIVISATLAAAAYSDSILVHKPAVVPPNWERVLSADVDRTGVMEVLVGLRRANPDQLDKAFWESSTPSSEKYLEHLSWEAVGSLVRPSEDAISDVVTWLSSHGATSLRVAAHGDSISASLSLEQLEIMTSGTFASFVHKTSGQVLVRLMGGVRLSAHVAKHIETFTGLHGFPLEAGPVILKNSSNQNMVTPALINKVYSIGQVKKSGHKNIQAIAQYQGQYVDPTSLSNFCKQFNPEGADCQIAKYVGSNNVTMPGIESMLDTEYIMGIGQGTTTWVYSYPNFDFCSDLLVWAKDVASEPEHPYVVSISYGSQFIGFCDEATVKRMSQDVQKLGAMGITVLIASGDDGSGGMSRMGSNNGKLAPSFPASVPYALAVGSTFFESGISGQEEATTQFGSGGGFSYDYAMPAYQADAVHAYLSKHPEIGKDKYAVNGRASPDVSTLGEQFLVEVQGQGLLVGGTSASTPTWAAIISLLNEECLSSSAGKKTLGFVNPLFYQNPQAFTDITAGSNAIGVNSGEGWKCEKGWDAATGLGTPMFARLQSVVRTACSRAAQVVV